ncbi:hypothetical protein [Mucilaginibacter pedocola]|uniref:Uncharacterized protein n=1 Tax=Mucilaginibacter pedocola TaxID=1792845 RepID=A0A1S9P8I3_9SPHI|nr:hypothetical protein [Mucilaginibacter pedocola]OOQ57147.1 hypothetical protein BC343_16640 [Mucilaginibacter pedocola]
MNKAATILERIRQALKFDDPAQTPAEHTLPDGTIITVSQIAIGGTVAIDGKPAPAGDYTLEDETMLIVDKAGTITKVKAPKAMAKDHQLADGTVLTVDKPEVGGKATVKGSPAPAGDYTLPDGTVITVGAAGLITKVVSGKVKGKTPAPKTPEQLRAAMKRFEGDDDEGALVSALADIRLCKESFTAQQQQLQALKIQLAKQQHINQELVALFTEFAKLPGGELPEQKKVFSFQRADSKKTKLDKYIDAAERIKEQQA